jgi:hypothetical protein
MNGLRRTHLISALLVAMALTSRPAAAVPPTADPFGAPAAFAAEQQPAATAPPENDSFANAVVVGSLPFATTVSTLEATAAPDDPACFASAASVWYAYTPPISTTLSADTFGSDYDTTLAAYTGTQGSLTEVACNDDAGGGLQSQIVFPVVAGQTYYLMAAGLSGGGNRRSPSTLPPFHRSGSGRLALRRRSRLRMTSTSPGRRQRGGTRGGPSTSSAVASRRCG